jgi:hypothetical protein
MERNRHLVREYNLTSMENLSEEHDAQLKEPMSIKNYLGLSQEMLQQTRQ